MSRLIVTIALVAFFAFGALSTIANTGKPRPPITGALAAVTTTFCALLVVGVIYLYGSPS